MKVLLEAPILTQSGYGEHARFVYRALKEDSLDVYINPLNWGTTGWLSDSNEERSDIDKCIRKNVMYVQTCQQSNATPSYDVQIFVGIANEFQKKAKYSVLVTAGIETDKVSQNWLVSLKRGVDKIIVPSEHAKNGFKNTEYKFNDNSGNQISLNCDKPVDVVPYPAKVLEKDQVDLDLHYDFNFLSVAMWGVRKNLENMVKWFVEEFRDEEVGLVLKTSLSRNSTPDRTMTKMMVEEFVESLGERKCKVYLLHGDLSDEQISSLYEHKKIKAYMSATHGEGYGLPLFEAACAGLPIVCTDWSGHLDFLTAPWSEKGKKKKDKKLFANVAYDLDKVPQEAHWENIIIPESRWAYPKEKSFKEKIRKVYEQNGMYKKFSKSLREHVLENYEYSKVLKQMNSSLIPDHMRPNKEWQDVLDSIEII